MAKRKKTEKKPKPAARKKPAPKKRPSGPRSQTLPDKSFDRIRNRRLDSICEIIAEERDRVNEARKEEVGLISSALDVMQKDGIQVYKHGGVELVRVPGAEKLRVRRVKDEGDAGVEDLEDTSDLETGAAQDVDNAANNED
jgi:hypothetical protein